MSRTRINVNHGYDFKEAEARVYQVLMDADYNEIERNGERVWRRGTGFTMMQYIKVEFGDNAVLLSGWVGNGPEGELALTGIIGAVPKRSVMKVLEKIKKALA